MQFRPPLRPSSDQSWQSQGFPTQQQVNLQQQLYPPQFQPPPVMQTQPPGKKSRKRYWPVIAAVVVVFAIVIAAGTLIANISSTGTPHTKVVPTQTEQSLSHSTPTVHSTVASKNPLNVKPTHGSPALFGLISDFMGTFGKPSTTNGKDTMWLLNTEGSLSLEARVTGGGIVSYVSISIPSSWSQQKAKTYCLSFAPHNYTQYRASTSNNSGDVYFYNSPSGNFALHVSSGYPLYCYMSNVSNP
jgi:hypothetical protein